MNRFDAGKIEAAARAGGKQRDVWSGPPAAINLRGT